MPCKIPLLRKVSLVLPFSSGGHCTARRIPSLGFSEFQKGCATVAPKVHSAPSLTPLMRVVDSDTNGAVSAGFGDLRPCLTVSKAAAV